MVLRSISLKDIFKLIPYKRINDLIPMIKVELILEVNFETFGQVRFKDENGRPRIIEFKGSKWVKELYFRELGDVSFNVFVNNQYLHLRGVSYRKLFWFLPDSLKLVPIR